MRIRDVTLHGSYDDLRANLLSIAKQLRSAGDALYNRTDLKSGCRVYPAIAESTAGQLELLARMLKEPIEITANICRTVLEINVILRYCLSSQQRLDNYEAQAGTDEISIHEAVKLLAENDTDPSILKPLDEQINHIRSVMIKHGKSLKTTHPPISQMANEVGMKKEYKSMYGVYSKYVHASAWFVIRKREHIDLPEYRFLMQVHTQLYAGDTLKRLEDL